jgi:protocatechuate 3,4-dioxygenase, beta subunit
MIWKTVFASSALTLVGFYNGDSGPAIGQGVPAFEPAHVTGPDKGTHDCPACKYTKSPGVQIWINGESDATIVGLVHSLEQQMVQYRKNDLHVFFVWPTKQNPERLEKLAKQAGVKEVAFLYLDERDADAVNRYRITLKPQIASTVILYKNRSVKSKFINLQADKVGLDRLGMAIKAICE